MDPLKVARTIYATGKIIETPNGWYGLWPVATNPAGSIDAWQLAYTTNDGTEVTIVLGGYPGRPEASWK